MNRTRTWLALALAAAFFVASGFSLEDLPLSGKADSAEEPGENLNLGDCLRKTDRSQWPPAYAAICNDLLSGIDAAAAEPERGASTPRTIPAKTAAAAPRPVARPTTGEETRATAPAPSCTIGAAGKVAIGDGKDKRIGNAHLIVPPAKGGSAPGLALGVPAACALESPAAGKIVFAGTFKGYRGVVIVELPGGRRLVVAGLGSLRVRRGDRVVPGDILGTSADERAPALAAAFGGNDPTLVFFDMRNRNGKAEALPWFTPAS